MWLILFVILIIVLIVVTCLYYYDNMPSFALAKTPKHRSVQTKSLRLTNILSQDIWVVAACGPYATPLPGMSNTLIKVPANSYYDVDIPLEGLESVRIYAKYGCDSNGLNCSIGDSVPLYTGPPCPYPYGCNATSGQTGNCGSVPCEPPLNSIMGEFTFGCFLSDTTKCAKNSSTQGPIDPVTYFDGSAVDGYSLPFSLIIKGNTGTCNPGASMPLGIDASELAVKNCPTNINLSSGGITSVTNQSGQVFDLTSVDLRYFDKNGNVVACYSPCQKLTSAFGQSTNITSSQINTPVGQYCCPTPPVDPDTCRAGLGANNQYTQSIRDVVPNIYTYSYDDVNALQTCGQGVQYEIIFGSSNNNYPYSP